MDLRTVEIMRVSELFSERCCLQQKLIIFQYFLAYKTALLFNWCWHFMVLFIAIYVICRYQIKHVKHACVSVSFTDVGPNPVNTCYRA